MLEKEPFLYVLGQSIHTRWPAKPPFSLHDSHAINKTSSFGKAFVAFWKRRHNLPDVVTSVSMHDAVITGSLDVGVLKGNVYPIG